MLQWQLTDANSVNTKVPDNTKWCPSPKLCFSIIVPPDNTNICLTQSKCESQTTLLSCCHCCSVSCSVLPLVSGSWCRYWGNCASFHSHVEYPCFRSHCWLKWTVAIRLIYYSHCTALIRRHFTWSQAFSNTCNNWSFDPLYPPLCNNFSANISGHS